jgi:hypothetical protein
MDLWNPIIAETHVKREPLLKVAAAFVLAVLAGLGALWVAAIVILSLDRMVS